MTYLVYKCNKYPKQYFRPPPKPQRTSIALPYIITYKEFPLMSKNINGADMPTLTVFRMELQRIIDMDLKIDPLITEYMRTRICEIEPPTQN